MPEEIQVGKDALHAKIFSLEVQRPSKVLSKANIKILVKFYRVYRSLQTWTDDYYASSAQKTKRLQYFNVNVLLLYVKKDETLETIHLGSLTGRVRKKSWLLLELLA